MGNIGLGELLILLIVVLVLFGPGKLPELGKSLGRAVGEFRKGIKEGFDETKSDSDKPSKPS